MVWGERAAGTVCIQLLWYDKEVCYEKVTLFCFVSFMTVNEDSLGVSDG